MHRIARFTDLLNLAGSYLHETSPQHARLSLILCDNVVELLAHEQCEFHVLLASAYSSHKKLSPADRADARGQEFAPKLNLLVRLGDLRNDERDFAVRAHTLRNECYHTACAHEQIARRVASEYHDLACTLFERLEPWGYALETNVPCAAISRALMEAAGVFDFLAGDWDNRISRLVESLRGTKPPVEESLAKVLSDAACSRFDNLIRALGFLAEDGLRGGTKDEAINEAYFRATVDLNALRAGLNTQTQEGFVEFHRRWDEAKQNYAAPLCFEQVNRWLSRSTALSHEQSASVAIVKYTDLLRESQQADDIIHEAARSLDTEIQHQIDEARGK